MTVSLETLPSEVLFHIFDYLPPRTLYLKLRLVCKRFAFLLARDSYFKVRFRRTFFKQGYEYPLLKYFNLSDDSGSWRSGNDISWTDIVVRTDIREQLWRRENNGFDASVVEQIELGIPHTATVDTVLMLDNGRLCVSGGRDRLICLWEVGGESGSYPLQCISEAHHSWIWAMTSFEEDAFFTCGWDTTVNHWALSPGGIQLIQKIPIERSAMSITSQKGLVAAGHHNGNLVLIDPRIASPKIFYSPKVHRGTVTDIKIWRDQLLTIGEDRRMCSFDIRNHKILVAQHVNSVLKTCPRSMGIYRDILYIGDSRGYLNIFHAASDFKPILCARVGQERAINALIPTLEGIIIGTSDVGLRFVIPCSPVQVIAQYHLHGEVTSIDYKNDVIVAGSSNSESSVHVLRSFRKYL